MLFGTDTTAVADMHHLQLMQLHCVSEKNIILFYFHAIFVRCEQISPILGGSMPPAI